MFKEKLKKLKANIKRWNKDIFGNVNQVGGRFDEIPLAI